MPMRRPATTPADAATPAENATPPVTSRPPAAAASATDRQLLQRAGDSEASAPTPGVTSITRTLLTLNRLRGVGPATLARLSRLPAAAEALAAGDISSVSEHDAAIARALAQLQALEYAQKKAEADLDTARRLGLTVVSLADRLYPPLLRDTRDAPPLLYVRGAVDAVCRPGVAVIGTREPTEHGTVVAQRVTGYFAAAGWPIVSGLAIGIDAAAHQTALNAPGITIAVLAHGLDMIYPRAHTALAERIVADGGALVSEYPPGSKPYGPQFVKRDRIQAGLALLTVLVQTGISGGSLHASRAALEYGRLLAFPVPTPRDVANEEPKIAGTLLLEREAPHIVAQYLRCSPNDLERLIAIRSRDDYPRIEARMHVVEQAARRTRRDASSTPGADPNLFGPPTGEREPPQAGP